ncbi:MAG: hypothetical protein DLM68_04265, partial [Hyphomicrobiales bacterium]
MLGPFIGQTDSKLRVIPGHPDAAAGMKPVGDFYLLGISKNTPSARPANQIQRISLNLTNGSGAMGQ